MCWRKNSYSYSVHIIPESTNPAWYYNSRRLVIYSSFLSIHLDRLPNRAPGEVLLTAVAAGRVASVYVLIVAAVSLPVDLFSRTYLPIPAVYPYSSTYVRVRTCTYVSTYWYTTLTGNIITISILKFN